MRTTITIDDELYRTVKQRAAQSGRTVGEIIEDAVRRALDERPRTGNEPLAPLPTYGGTGVLPGVDLTNNAALRDLMDADEPVDALR
ncbi:MAG: ribbon-helix-helix domain-containing protein [Egibacteraceae bacterium]